MRSISIIRYLILSVALPVTNAFYFYLNSKTLTCSGDPFTEVVLTHECVEPEFYGEEQFYGPICFWGDHVMISGSVIAESHFPTNGQVVAVPEFLNWQRYNDEDMQSMGRVCELLVPLEGQTCGASGSYGFDLEIVLPYKPETWYQKLIDEVTSITIHFNNGFMCEEARFSHNVKVPQEVSGIGFGIAFGALFAVWNGKRRRRNQRQNEDDDCDDQYVEMGQQPRRTNGSLASDPVVQWRRKDSVIDANEMMEQQRVIYGDDMDQYRSRV
mmetsp:Transcript_13753/g.22602  ORF Transcript_13753/g.22602 Transcript_13753/m.22602 type:complete len:270 (-) Transcript_13753:45-854(-)